MLYVTRPMRWLLLVLVSLWTSTAAAEAPAVCTAKIAATPDFCQTDEAGGFDNGGRKYCGPVAVSNSLVWLSQNGFPKLLQPANSPSDSNNGNGSANGDHKADAQKAAQIELIRTLGSPNFMSTEGRDGTSATRLMRGLKKYVTEHGYQIEQLEYRGWSNVSKSFKPTGELPSLDWMKQHIAEPGGAAWINIGWYNFDETTKKYQRTGGHWITLVGYGVNAEGKPDDSVLIVHDPSRRTGPGIVTHHMRVTKISEGKLIDDPHKQSTDAAGRHKVVDGFVIKQGNNAAVLDGAVVAVLKK
jgi:hypothetical protein